MQFSFPLTTGALRAAVWMMGTLVSFTVMAVAIRELSATHHTFEILTYRSLICVVVLVLVACFTGFAALATVSPFWQIGRNLVHFVGQAGWTYAIAVLPLATVFTLEFTVPAWTALLAIFLLGERLNGGRALALAGGIAGVLVILRPGFAPLDRDMLIMLGAAVAYAGAHTITKHLTRTDGVLAILFWMSVIQLPIAVTLAVSTEGLALPALAETPAVATVALAALAAHFCMTRALAAADMTFVMPLDFLRLPLIVLVGGWLYGEVLAPEVALGAAVIVASLLLALRRELYANGRM